MAAKSKPKGRLFIGSSSEANDVTNELNYLLDKDAHVVVWTLLFEPGKETLQTLIEEVETFDFGIFVFTPDDIVKIRKKNYSTVRDNVILELGLFIGRLGLKRTFIVMPRNTPDFRMPTDLLGVTFATYEAKRPDKDLRAALNAPATQIRSILSKLGQVKQHRRKSLKAFKKGATRLTGTGLPITSVPTPKTKTPPTKSRLTPKRKIRILTKR